VYQLNRHFGFLLGMLSINKTMKTKAENQLSSYKPVRKNGTRVKRVFDKAKEAVSEGKKPVISAIMREEGYSPSACACLKVMRTATWKQLLDTIPDNQLLGELFNLATDPDDKRTKLEALKEIFRLKDKYPAGKMQIGAFQNQANEFFEDEK
jgi:hypothetical protein